MNKQEFEMSYTEEIDTLHGRKGRKNAVAATRDLCDVSEIELASVMQGIEDPDPDLLHRLELLNAASQGYRSRIQTIAEFCGGRGML